MPKNDDTNQVPDKLTAPWLKRFFKRKFDIPVRVRTLSGRAGYIEVWIASDRSRLHELKYDHDFPAELGNRCMRVVYPNSEQLREQNWGGNIGSHSLSMIVPQWKKVLQGLIDDPITVAS